MDPRSLGVDLVAPSWSQLATKIKIFRQNCTIGDSCAEFLAANDAYDQGIEFWFLIIRVGVAPLPVFRTLLEPFLVPESMMYPPSGIIWRPNWSPPVREGYCITDAFVIQYPPAQDNAPTSSPLVHTWRPGTTAMAPMGAQWLQNLSRWVRSLYNVFFLQTEQTEQTFSADDLIKLLGALDQSPGKMKLAFVQELSFSRF